MRDNVIYIGDKSPSAYAYSVNTIFNEKKLQEVFLKARGNSIVKAVNLAEFLKRKGEIEIASISTGSEQFQSNKDKEKQVYVSSIEIRIIKL